MTYVEPEQSTAKSFREESNETNLRSSLGPSASFSFQAVMANALVVMTVNDSIDVGIKIDT